ncbi:Small heat shock protein chloroplastic [Bienertia sinuspersici]
MASMALRRIAGKDLVSGAFSHPLRALYATRGFNTNAQMTRVDDERDDRSDRAPVSRRRDFPATGFFSDVFDPFTRTRSVGQLMDLMDQLMENPFMPASRGMGSVGGGSMRRRGWDVREDEDALHLKVDMPGLGKEDVKVSVEENTLVIKGEAAAEEEAEEDRDAENRRRYSSRIDLTPNMYKIDGIKAEMKNGVLKVTVPKLQEEKKDVHQVTVD